MATEKNINIDENELDSLLSLAFLNLDITNSKTDKMMETVAKRALSTKVTWLYNLTKFVGIAAIIICIGALVFYATRNRQDNLLTNSKGLAFTTKAMKEIPTEQKSEHKNVEIKSSVNTKQHYLKINTKYADNYVKVNQVLFDEPSEENNEEIAYPSIESKIEKQVTENYVFPVLTEKEIKNNEKNKKLILKYISKPFNSIYPKIAVLSGTGDYLLKSAEITNKEYRTFLFDLLIQGKKEEFIKAKPHQDLWINIAGQTAFNQLANDYFTEKKYDDYPVVNITPEAAEMYCNWLQDELELYNKNEVRPYKLLIKLPQESDWITAARAGRPNAKFSWPHDSIQNLANCFMANCCIQKLKNEIFRPICNNHLKYDEGCYTSAGMMLRDSTAATALVYCYNPSAFGLFAMCGNASELVYVTGTTKTRAVGGNWASDFKHLEIGSTSEFSDNPGPSPMIGFRICVQKIAK